MDCCSLLQWNYLYYQYQIKKYVLVICVNWPFKAGRVYIYPHRQANTEADVLVQISYLLSTKWLCTHSLTSAYTHVLWHISMCTQKRMWECESIMLCCHRVTCEPWQGADGPGVPSFLLAVPFSFNTHTHTHTHTHTTTISTGISRCN